MGELSLSSSELEIIRQYGASRRYPANTIVINEGDRTAELYVILSGSVRVYSSNDQGREVILVEMEAGDHFGEIALIDGAPRSASVMAREPLEVLILSPEAYDRCLSGHPQLGMKLLRTVSHRLRTATEDIKSMALLDVYGRIARLLGNLAIKQDNEGYIEPKLTHQEIANRVGASREMVSRIMKDLAAGGYVRAEANRIVLRLPLPARW